MSNLFENWELETNEDNFSLKSFRPLAQVDSSPPKRSLSAAPSSRSTAFNPFASPTNPFISPAAPLAPFNPFAVGTSRPATAPEEISKESPSSQKFSANESASIDTIISENIFRLKKPTVNDSYSQKQNSLSILSSSVSKNAVYLATNECKVIRWSPSKTMKFNGSNTYDEVEVSKRQDSGIKNLFSDWSGNHLIISMHGGDVFYLNSMNNKPKKLLKWVEIKVECIFYDNKKCSESNAALLIGSSQGEIFETSVDNMGRDKVPILLYVLKDEQPISSIILESTPSSVHRDTRWLLLAATASPTRLYTFIGGPTLEQLFKSYKELGAAPFQELPGRVPAIRLNCYFEMVSEESSSKKNSLKVVLHSFAMLTAEGIFFGKISHPAEPKDDVNVNEDFSVENTQLLSYPGVGTAPLSLAVTRHHFLCLYRDRLVTVSKLTGQVVEDISLDLLIGHPVHISGIFEPQNDSADDNRSGLYLFTDRSFFEIHAYDEARDIWRAYLERAMAGDEAAFDDAIINSPGPYEEAHIRCEKANYFYTNGKYILSADEYSQTNAPFEEISLNFNEIHQSLALRRYVQQKLELLDPFAQKSQCTMLSTWLIELYLRELNFQSIDSQNSGQTSKDFRNFMQSYFTSLNPVTTSKLLTSHGRIDELLLFAELSEDYETILSHHLLTGGFGGSDYLSAISILERAPLEKVESLVYRLEQYINGKYSSVLMDADPAKTVNLWMGKPGLVATKLMPALVRHSKNRDKSNSKNWAVVYLEYCVHTLQLQDAAIHNYLIAMYAQIEYESDTISSNESVKSALLELITQPPERRFYNLTYALRVCAQYERQRACVHIYSAMSLFEEAVELALSIDLNLAKQYANSPKDSDLRKRLWLKVIKHTIQESTDATIAMSLLTECDSVNMEDILPFFPDFAIIDSFKTDICASLESYNKSIENLKEEMCEYSRVTEAVQEDIQRLNKRVFYVGSSQVCELCDYPLLAQEFYLFPCNHGFHSQCMQVHMKQHLSADQREAVELITGELRKLEQLPVRNKRTMLKISSLKSEIDSYTAAECILCGDVIIQNIDKSLLLESTDEEAASWLVQ